MLTHDSDPVLFVMAPGGLIHRFSEHLGTAFLRAVLRRAGIGSRQYLPKRNPSLAGFADFLRETRPRVVGFTVYETNLVESRSLVRVIRETLPESVILVGGPNATFTPEETLDLVGADVCSRGAGEGTVVPLVQGILGAGKPVRLGDALRDVPNLVLRAPDGVVHTTAGDLSSFPATSFRTLDDIPSPFQEGIVSTPDVGYLTARGCNQHCSYCSFATISGRKVAFHGVERVLDDLQALEALAARTPRSTEAIQIFDDAFSLVPERARRICEGMIERGIRLPFHCQTRGDRVTPGLLDLMRRAGFVGISFGLESAVPRVLRTIGKVCAPDTADDPHFEREREFLERFRGAVAHARRCGMNVNVSVIGGLPGETADDFRATLEFVSTLEASLYAHNVLSLFPGTPLYDRRHDYGLDAFREPRTEVWRTVHAYAVSDVRPLSHSTEHRWKWQAAATLSDALCGRPGSPEADAGSVWAVVLHGPPPSPALSAWLRNVLAVHGSLAVFAASRAEADTWRRFLTSDGVPFGTLSCLVPDGTARETSFDVLDSTCEQHVRFLSAWPDATSVPVEVDEDGNCTMSIWVASAPDARPRGRTGKRRSPIGPGLQVADSCRLGYTAPRCRRPRVLHVDARGGIRACWHGPVLGVVGDDARGTAFRPRRRAARKPATCPLAPPRGMNRSTRSRLWDLDVASQLDWVFLGPTTSETTWSEDAERSDSWTSSSRI